MYVACLANLIEIKFCIKKEKFNKLCFKSIKHQVTLYNSLKHLLLRFNILKMIFLQFLLLLLTFQEILITDDLTEICYKIVELFMKQIINRDSISKL